ncbi:hypothetical protein PSN45_002201 [Yamadazyma tenuis]|uniref:uncharacterized protein n=1 Tax=Candida tenuis TaxID=2315449 RepID=UPI00279BEB17|nr:hypothetical protein PSN45_002201 [Yamadazyma tenuis]
MSTEYKKWKEAKEAEGQSPALEGGAGTTEVPVPVPVPGATVATPGAPGAPGTDLGLPQVGTTVPGVRMGQFPPSPFNGMSRLPMPSLAGLGPAVVPATSVQGHGQYEQLLEEHRSKTSVGQDDKTTSTSLPSRPVSGTRRAAQNRSAQKAFRQRKQRYIEELEATAEEVQGLKRTIEDLKTENLRLRDYTIALQGRIIELGSDMKGSSDSVYNKIMSTRQ